MEFYTWVKCYYNMSQITSLFSTSSSFLLALQVNHLFCFQSKNEVDFHRFSLFLMTDLEPSFSKLMRETHNQLTSWRHVNFFAFQLIKVMCYFLKYKFRSISIICWNYTFCVLSGSFTTNYFFVIISIIWLWKGKLLSILHFFYHHYFIQKYFSMDCFVSMLV